MSSSIQQSFKSNLNFLKCLYLYLPDQKPGFYKLKSYLIFLLCVPIVPILGTLYLVFTENLEVEKMKNEAAFLVQTMWFIPKLFPILKNGYRISKCINSIDLSFDGLTKEDEKEVKQCIVICQRSTKYFSITSVVAVISWAMVPMFAKERILPVDLWLPFNTTKNTAIYWCVYTYLVLAIMFCGLASGFHNPLIGGLLYHATVQVKLLKNKLQRLNEDANEEVANQDVKDESERLSFKNEIIYKKIGECLSQHEVILIFVKEYDFCFSQTVFSQFASSVFAICFVCLKLSKNFSADMDFAFNISLISDLLVEIYFYCYYGTTLTTESDALTTAVYNCNWYDFDSRCKNALITIMQQTQKPIVLTVGKLVDLSLVTFASLLRKSYSLITLLQNFQ